MAVCWGAVLAGAVAGLGGWLLRSPPPASAWAIEQPEKIIRDPKIREEQLVSFRIRNVSSEPRRVLGAYSC